jgi:hypothetical protein
MFVTLSPSALAVPQHFKAGLTNLSCHETDAGLDGPYCSISGIRASMRVKKRLLSVRKCWGNSMVWSKNGCGESRPTCGLESTWCLRPMQRSSRLAPTDLGFTGLVLILILFVWDHVT